MPNIVHWKRSILLWLYNANWSNNPVRLNDDV